MGSASSGSGRPSYEELETLVAEQAALIEALQARVAEQAAVIEELERRLNRNSSNSSLPPSSDPPLTRAERRRRAREKLKQMSKEQRKPGGQPGHEGKHRAMAPIERVDVAASICLRCAGAVTGSAVVRSGSVTR